MSKVSEATSDRRTSGSARRIPSATSQHPRSARDRSREDLFAGGSSALRPGPCTRDDDYRGGAGQRFFGRRPARNQRARSRSSRPGSCHRTALNCRRRNGSIGENTALPGSRQTRIVKTSAELTSDVLTAMADEGSELKAFNGFGIDEVTPRVSISRRMSRWREDIYDANTASLAI